MSFPAGSEVEIDERETLSLSDTDDGEDETPPPVSILPLELKTLVAEYLGLHDVRNLRSVSKAWATAGNPELFKGGLFTMRPYLNDMERLKEIGTRPWLAKYVKHIKIYVGDVDPRYLKKAFDSEAHHYGPKITKKMWSSVKRQMELFSKMYCNLRSLLEIFPLFTNVASLTVTSRQNPFARNFSLQQSIGGVKLGFELMQSAWERMTEEHSVRWYSYRKEVLLSFVPTGGLS